MELPLLNMDHRALVSRADLIYHSPVETPLEGQPIGNGAMGTMVWTVPSVVCLQINRCDVYAVSRHHDGPQGGDTDYCGGCAQVTIRCFVSSSADILLSRWMTGAPVPGPCA